MTDVGYGHPGRIGLYREHMPAPMKTCSKCGYASPDDSSFCMKCGAYFESESASRAAVVQTSVGGGNVDPGKSMEQGFAKIEVGDFSGAVARWTDAIKAGFSPSAEDYRRMLDGCVDVIISSSSDGSTHSRAGIADLAILMDDYDLITDIMAGIRDRSEQLGTQRELMNTMNEYMFLAIESFSVYTDLNDLAAICDEAVRVFNSAAEVVESLERAQSKHDPLSFLQNYSQFFQILGDKIDNAVSKTDPAILEELSDHWAERSTSRFSDLIMGASNMNAQLIAAGWLGSKVAVKARDMQLDTFVTMYLAPGMKQEQKS